MQGFDLISSIQIIDIQEPVRTAVRTVSNEDAAFFIFSCRCNHLCRGYNVIGVSFMNLLDFLCNCASNQGIGYASRI